MDGAVIPMRSTSVPGGCALGEKRDKSCSAALMLAFAVLDSGCLNIPSVICQGMESSHQASNRCTRVYDRLWEHPEGDLGYVTCTC